MSDEIVPIWKEALKDNQHPLHQATWLVFGDSFNPKFADRQLSAQKDEVIQYLYLILDTEDLYEESALGSGYAPCNAVKLLGYWQFTEAIPRIMQIIMEEDFDAMVWNEAMLAMENMGAAAIDAVFEALNHKLIDTLTAVSILSKAGQGEEGCFEFIREVFEGKKDKFDIQFMAEMLLLNNQDRAIPYLEARLQEARYPRDVRQRVEDYILDAKAGNFPEP